MRYAILISGQPRTFDFEEQYHMFKRFLSKMDKFDVYILFKMKGTRPMNKSVEKIIKLLILDATNKEIISLISIICKSFFNVES